MYSSDSALLDHFIRQAATTVANPVFLQRMDLGSLQHLLHQVQLECARRHGQFQPQRHTHTISDWHLGQYHRSLPTAPGDGPYFGGQGPQCSFGGQAIDMPWAGSPEQQAEVLRNTYGTDGQKLTGNRGGYAELIKQAVVENETRLPHEVGEDRRGPIGGPGTYFANSEAEQYPTDQRTRDGNAHVGEMIQLKRPEPAEPMRALPIMIEGINFPMIQNPDDGKFYVTTPSLPLRKLMDELAGVTINGKCPGDYSPGDDLVYYVDSLQHTSMIHASNLTTGKDYVMNSTLKGLNSWYIEQALKLAGEQQ